MHREVIKWLKHLGFKISSNWLRLRLESHPDYPSLSALQDTLSEIGINSYACEGTKEELAAEKKPFLAHFNVSDGYIRFFKTVTEAEDQVKDFDKQWSGHVMFADNPANYGNTEHNQEYKTATRNRYFFIAAISIFILAAITLSISNENIPALFLTLTGFTGLYFSWLITEKELGISNSITDKICSVAVHSRCESVLFSKGARLFTWLSWGDMGIVFFTASVLFLLTTQLTNLPITFYHFLSVAGLVFPLYSLWYQWRVVKQWCMLCIAVLAVLVINAVIGLVNLYEPVVINALVYPAILFTVLFITTLCVWQIIKYLYGKSIGAIASEIKALRLKRNPDIFNALLDKEEYNSMNMPEPDEAICFGKPDAPYKIVMACNPYCGPCSKAHHAIEELYENNPDDFSVSIRFALRENNDADKTVQIAKTIMKAARINPFKAVKDWYRLFDMEKYNTLHTVNGLDVNSYTERHIQWCKNAGINATPTLFINGKRLPGIYNWKEFVELMEIKTQ
jgi:uncharacterized membrane protein